MELPCGSCRHCRKQKALDWSKRLVHEMIDHDKCMFLTLTYSPKSIPDNASLRKDHLQSFFKRLRHHGKLKHYSVGEYGDKYHRPHYHSILYGYDMHDLDLLKTTWGHGHIKGGLVEAKSINYVTQYVQKKLTGPAGHEAYTCTGREPVFSIMSKGLGLSYALKHQDTLIHNLKLRYQGNDTSIPRYYVKKLGITPEQLQAIRLEADCEITERYCGIYASIDDLYKISDDSILTYYKERDKVRSHKDATLAAKLSLFKREAF